MDIKLDLTGDLDVTNGEVTLTDGTEAIAQDMTIRLKTFLGEWFLDQRIGLPYFQSILIKNPNLPVIQTIFRQAILETTGIVDISDFEFNFDTSVRQLSISFEAKTEDLDTFIFEFSELIL